MTITDLAPRAGRRWWLVEDDTCYGLIRESILDDTWYVGLYCEPCQGWDCRHVLAVAEREKGTDG